MFLALCGDEEQWCGLVDGDFCGDDIVSFTGLADDVELFVEDDGDLAKVAATG